MDPQQGHGDLRQTITGQPASLRQSSAEPRACASPSVTRIVATKYSLLTEMFSVGTMNPGGSWLKNSPKFL
ncbi:hypothetical protein D3C83_208290 [compost metagenome]